MGSEYDVDIQSNAKVGCDVELDIATNVRGEEQPPVPPAVTRPDQGGARVIYQTMLSINFPPCRLVGQRQPLKTPVAARLRKTDERGQTSCSRTCLSYRTGDAYGTQPGVRVRCI